MLKTQNSFLYIGLIILSFVSSCKQQVKKDLTNKDPLIINQRWSEEKANAWAANNPWLRGANFNPSTAINQLEFWQVESFDPVTIDRELGWAQDIGLNCMRVYLHHLAWEIDKTGFKERINTYLSIA